MGNEWRNKPRSPMDTSQGSGGADKKIMAFAILLILAPILTIAGAIGYMVVA